jgi:hypothetical protein
MKQLVRILAVLLLAAFTAGTFAHAAATTDMSVGMVMAADFDMDDCDGCSEQSSGMVTCDQGCIQSFAALPASASAETALAPASLRLSVPHGLVGRTGPPERHPPR